MATTYDLHIINQRGITERVFRDLTLRDALARLGEYTDGGYRIFHIVHARSDTIAVSGHLYGPIHNAALQTDAALRRAVAA